MKPLLASLLLVFLAGCIATTPESRLPTIVTDLQSSVVGDKLVLRYRLYEIARGELDLRAAGVSDIPTEKNTVLYERFAQADPTEKLPGVEVPFEVEYIRIARNGQRSFLIDTSGREIHPTHDYVAMLKDRQTRDYFGYVLVRRDHSPVVFFVKPRVFPSRTKLVIPNPAGWKD